MLTKTQSLLTGLAILLLFSYSDIKAQDPLHHLLSGESNLLPEALRIRPVDYAYYPIEEDSILRIKKKRKKKDRYDGPDKAAALEYRKTKDPATGKVPRELLINALRMAEQSKAQSFIRRAIYGSRSSSTTLRWMERGPNSDEVGSSNGNTRANSGKASGRVRAVMVDSTDPTKKTVWIGGVAGGLWKTRDITASPANWLPVNDYLSNLAVTDICQDPRPGFQNIMYFCTGEAYYNADAVRGNGVFKSTDGGVTWSQLSSTTSYIYCTRILCDYLGNVYLATRGSGLLRSTNGGSTWTTITPSGFNTDICDLEISSTSGAGRLHAVSGIFTTQRYAYTDIPATATTSSWTSPVTAFPSYSNRAEIACLGNVLYALPVDGSNQIPSIYRSTDGGANWTITSTAPPSGWANGQGWYDVSVGINPSNSNQVIVGAIDSYKSTDGGSTWTKISNWVGTSGQYVHADIHDIVWYDGGNKLIYGCDGGIHYSSDGGTTIRDRNAGLRIKQFYSVDIHPTATNYFIGGTQDNGTHQLSSPGLANSIEVTGGDGAFVAIDQNEPQYQFGAYVYNDYRRSSNSGSSWTYCGFYKGTSSSPSDFGDFINPFDYDNSGNVFYATADNGEYFRWTTAQTTPAGDYFQGSGFPTGAEIVSSITGFNSGQVSALKVSPFTSNRVYFGISNGRIVRIDNAHTAASGTAGTVLTTPVSANVSCINFGTTEQNMIVSYSNYNISNVWISTNGGTSWTAVDGNLPNMPVRWCMFYPGSNTRAIIATEAGIWETTTLNGSSTVWTANPTFPSVRTDMIKFRAADSTFVAGTHGRGIFTTTICNSTPAAPAGTGFTLCNATGGTVTLSATPGEGETIDWYTAADGGMLLLSSSNTFTTPFLTSSATYYAASRNTTTGCISDTRTAVTATVIIISGTLPTVSASASPTEVCAGISSTLSASSSNSSYAYSWSPGSLAGSSVAVAPASTQTYTVTASDTLSSSQYFGCQTTATVTVIVKPIPTVPAISPATAQICPGQVQAFTASSTYNSTLSFGTQAAVNVASTTSTGYPAPYNVYYGGQRMQILIRASELTAAGFVSGHQITSLQFPVVSLGSSWGTSITALQDFRVRIGTTSLTTLSSFQTGLTQVVAPAAFTPQVGYNNSHTFSTPFTWNGTSNIILETTFSNNITGDNGEMVVQHNSPAGFNNCIVYRADNVTSTSAASATTVNFTYSSRPDLKLNGTRVSGITWSPLTGLYKNAAATTVYTGDTTSVIYAKPSAAGTYTYSATAASSNGCTASASVTLINTDNQSPTITAPVNVSVNASAGVCSISVSSVNLGTPVTNDNCSVASVTNNAPSSFTVGVNTVIWTVTDGAGNTATATQTVTVADNQAPSITAPATVTVIANASSCSATGVSLGTPTTSDNCSVSSVTNNAPASFPLGNTTVIWTVSDASGNTATASQTVTVQSNISGTPIAGNASRCGTGTVTITATAGSGETVDWYANSSGGSPLLSGSSSYTSPSIIATTTYYAQSRNTSTGCISGRTAVTATVNFVPFAPTTSVTQPTCSISTGSITVTSATTGLNFSIDGSNYSNTSGNFSGLASGSYSVTSRDTSGCTSSATSVTINSQPSTPSAPTASVTQPTCSISTGSITVTSSITGLNFSIDGSNYSNTSGIFTGLASGNYSVTARNTSGCTSSATSVTINSQPSTPLAPTVSITHPTCTNSTGSITVTSSTTGLNFSVDGSSYSNTSGIFTGLASGNYSVTVRNTSGCTSTATLVTINSQPSTPLAPTVSLTDPTCSISTGSITVTSATTGLNFSIDGSNYSNTTGIFTGLASGNYNVTARNTSGCISSATSVTINSQPTTPSAPTVSVTQPTCSISTGSITVTSATTGLNFSIDGSSYSNTSGIFAGLAPGNYSLTSRNASGCTSSAVSVTINSQPVTPAAPSASDSSRCGPGTVELSAAVPAGVTIDWYDNISGGNLLLTGSAVFITPSISATTVYYAESRNITAGCLSIGRTAVSAIILQKPATPTISASGPLSFCNGDSVILTSNSPINNIWNTGDTGISIKATLAGFYSVRVENDGCLSEADTVAVIITPCQAGLNVRLYIQGYYLGGGMMQSPLFNSNLTNNPTLSDSITVELHHPISPFGIAAVQKGIVSTSGFANFSFPSLSGEYYIAIRHRNALETWSAAPVNITGNTFYDFTDAASKAYGNNQYDLGSNKYGFYSGDVNQDGSIESQDYSEMENSVLSILFGYYPADLTGDGVVESNDYTLMENNILLILFMQRPF